MSASELMFHEEALYQVYVPLPFHLRCNSALLIYHYSKKIIKIFRIHIVIRIVTKIYSTLASQPSHPYKNFIDNLRVIL